MVAHTGEQRPQRLMDKTITNNTPLSELTVGEFLDLLRTLSVESQATQTVHGLQGLADLLGCSVSTVKRYYPLLRPAIAKRGRTIVANKDKVLTIWAGRRNFLTQ